MFVVPGVPAGATPTSPSPGSCACVAWGFGIPGLVLSYYAAITYIPIMRAEPAPRAGPSGGAAAMKAVIMAGGEGTPPAPAHLERAQADAARRQPADDGARHRPAAPARLRRDRGDRGLHGQRHPRPTSATAPSSACSITYADEPSPLGTAGSVRNATELLDERFLVHLRRRHHRHRPRRKIVAFHDDREAMATIGLTPVDEPARVRHRHHPRGRLDRALPREADVGPGLQRHHQHRHLRARAGDLRLHRRRPHRSTSRARSSRSCWPTAGRCTARSPRATGRTSARSRPTSAPTRTCSTRWCMLDIPGFQDQRRRVAGGGGRDLARRRRSSARP